MRIRTPNTLDALEQLSKREHMDEGVTQELAACYVSLRQLENAIQMLGNEQTHIVPSSEQARDNIMSLLGEKDWQGYLMILALT